MLMTLRILRGIAGFIAVWQVIGLLPVLTNWLPNASATTGNMWAIAFVKFLVLLICSTAFYWLGRIKKRYENPNAPTTELPAIGIALAAVLVVGLAAAFIIPTLGKESAQPSSTQVIATSSTAAGISSTVSSDDGIQGEWRCTQGSSSQPTRLVLASDGSVSGTVEGSENLIQDPWLRWYAPAEPTSDRVYLLRIKRVSSTNIIVTNPNDSIENCIR